MQVEAVDGDAGVNNEVYYDIIAGQCLKNRFAVIEGVKHFSQRFPVASSFELLLGFGATQKTLT